MKYHELVKKIVIKKSISSPFSFLLALWQLDLQSFFSSKIKFNINSALSFSSDSAFLLPKKYKIKNKIGDILYNLQDIFMEYKQENQL